MSRNCVLVNSDGIYVKAGNPTHRTAEVKLAQRYTEAEARSVVEMLRALYPIYNWHVLVVHNTIDYLNSQSLTEALWWFIENREALEDDEATGIFFALRQRVREGA